MSAVARQEPPQNDGLTLRTFLSCLFAGGSMENLDIVIALILGVTLGLIIGWLWRGSRSRPGDPDDAARLALLEDRAKRTEAIEAQLKERTSAAQEAEKNEVQLRTELEGLKARMDEDKVTEAEREVDRKAEEAKKAADQELMVAKFKAAAHEIVEERTKAFDKTSKKSIGELVKPLKEQLEGFRKQLTETEKNASKERISLEEQVKHLREMNARISDEAQNLTRALKGDSKARGNWGEMVLARVLELSGLEEGREFETEVSQTNEDGKRKRPDVIVHLPGDRQVVIDAKVSLNDYDTFCESEGTEDQNAALKRHVASIRGHVKGLSGKNYQHLENITTIDYVLMFMPIEAAFTEAMRFDRALYDEAISKKVLIVTPSTLLAVLRTIETIWRHERQTRNSVEIARQAGALYDKFAGFSGTLEQIGQRIGQAQTAYDNAYSQLSTGKGNLVSRVKRLEALGAKTSKKLPDSLNEVELIEDLGDSENPEI